LKELKTGRPPLINKVFVIGGSEIYKSVLDSQAVNNRLYKPSTILITRILSEHPSIETSLDAFFPEFRASQHWSKSQNPKLQNEFLSLPDHDNREEENSTGLAGDPQNQLPFNFDQLIIENSFMYKFELWTNNT
jgi:dihydrofolate reductase